MVACIDCSREFKGGKGVSICPECVDKRVAELTPEKLIAMAKTGLDAVIDEVTGYEKIRGKSELKTRYNKYLNGVGESNEVQK